jgi:hypothetical protein
VLIGALAGLGVVLAAAIVAVTRVGRAPDETRVNVVSGHPTETPLPISRHEAALAFIRGRDVAGATHVRRIVWSGPMLRVYTDLPKSAANSRTAIALCRAAASYLASQDRNPDVFVHARSRDGYQVLANKMNARDDCRLNGVP